MIGSLIQAGPILDDLPPFSKVINVSGIWNCYTSGQSKFVKILSNNGWKQVDKS